MLDETRRITRILIIEDDADDVFLFSEALKSVSNDIELQHCGDILSAMDMLVEPQLPDIILLDWNLPIYGGNDCLALIKKMPSLEQIPVIVFSTTVSPSAVKKAFDNRASLVVEKPVHFRRLEHIIGVLLEKDWSIPVLSPDDQFVIK